MRLLVLILVISAATTGFASSKRALDKDTAIDPIVTGVSISAAHKLEWTARKGSKPIVQPYPGDAVTTKVND